MSKPSRSGGPRLVKLVIAAVVGIVLAALLVAPWPQHTPEPIILGVIPAPLFFWILWTALFVAYVAWIVVGWDPYADIVRRNGPPRDRTESTES